MTDEHRPQQGPGGAAPVAVGAVCPTSITDDQAEEGLPRRFGVNVTANYLVTAAAGLSTLVVTPLLLRHLGREAFGVWVLALSFVEYLELLELGFGGAAIKLVAEDAGRRPMEVVRTVNTSFFILALLGVAALAIGLLIAALAPAWFSVGAQLEGDTTAVIALMAVALAISVPADSFDGALLGFQRFDLSGAVNGAMIVLTALVSVAVVLLGGGLVALSVGAAAVSVGMHPLRWVLLRRVLPQMRLGPGFVDRARVRAIAHMSGWFLMSEAAYLVVARVDVVVAGLVLGVKEAAVFAVGAKLAQLAQKALRQLTLVFLPNASHLSKGGETGRLAAQLLDGTRTAMLIGLSLTVVLGLLATSGVRAWVGPGYGDAATVLMILALSTAVQSVGNVAFMTNIGSGRIREVSLFGAAEALVNVGLSVVLARRYGVVGVALGTLVATVTVQVPAMVSIALRDAGLPLTALWRRAVRPHVPPLVVSGAVLLALRPLGEHGAVAVVGVACAGLAAYATCYMLVGASPAERQLVAALAGPVRRVLRRG